MTRDIETDWFEVGFQRLAWHVEKSSQKLDYDHAVGGKLPRNHIWRPYRFCVQDILFGSTVVRHAREYNCLEVDVFLTAEIPEYEPGSATHALAIFLLSEAYKCGGSMEIRFTEHVEGKKIPLTLCQLAESVDATFKPDSISQGRISPYEARNLFAKLTGFSAELKSRIDGLDAQGRLSVERVCYSIHHGVWTLNEIESVVLSSIYPDIVLSGEIHPEQRHLYTHVLFQSRSALLGGYLDRRLVSREYTDHDGAAFDLEDDDRDIIIEFESSIFAKWYYCPDEPMPIPWLVEDEELLIYPHDNVVVLIRSRDAIGLRQHLAHDIELIAERSVQATEERYFVLVPFDFYDPFITDKERQAFINHAKSRKIGIIVCPEPTFSLDAEIRKRFMSSRIIRE